MPIFFLKLVPSTTMLEVALEIPTVVDLRRYPHLPPYFFVDVPHKNHLRASGKNPVKFDRVPTFPLREKLYAVRRLGTYVIFDSLNVIFDAFLYHKLYLANLR